jgi:hypothetical protein
MSFVETRGLGLPKLGESRRTSKVLGSNKRYERKVIPGRDRTILKRCEQTFRLHCHMPFHVSSANVNDSIHTLC